MRSRLTSESSSSATIVSRKMIKSMPVPRIERMRAQRYVLKASINIKKLPTAQMTVSSRSCVPAARLSPYVRAHIKSAPMRIKESFGVNKPLKF